MIPKDNIDFARLTLMDALDLGILIEEDARARYGEFVDQMKTHNTPGAAAFFSDMVVNETKHRDTLAARRRTLFGSKPAHVNARMLFEIEAPPFQEAEAFMTLKQALDVAMRAEIRAYNFFASALPSVRDPQVRELFEELRDEELEHQTMVKHEMDKLPHRPEPNAGPHVDAPVGM